MLEEYRDRWQLVAAFEAEEQRQASFVQRWQKLNALLRMAAALGLQADDSDDQDEMIWQRWNRLRTSHLAQAQVQR
jgi:hypothetical protein